MSRFVYSIEHEGNKINFTEDCRCKNVIQRGSVPVPPGLETALRACCLPEIASKARERAQKTEKQLEIGCRILGVVKPFDASAATLSHSVGAQQPGDAVVLLDTKGKPVQYLLCAQVEGSQWYCHAGTRANGTLNEENPFDIADIVVQDVGEGSARPGRKKRLRKNAKTPVK